MKFRFTFALLFLFVSFFFISCKDLLYTPYQENYVNVPPTPYTQLSIDLTNLVDTIFAYGPTQLMISVDTKGKPFSRIMFYLDSSFVGSSTNPSNYLINTQNYSDGYHKFRMEVWARSNSGSFADKYEREFIIGSKTYNMIIDNREYKGSIEVDSIYAWDGSLKITWDQYPYRNLESYEIYRSTDDGYNYTLLKKITVRDSNFYLDSTYLGGKVEYKVNTKAEGKIFYSSIKTFSDTSGEIMSVTEADESTLKIVTSKLKYYKDVQSYKLMRSYEGVMYNPQVVKEWTNHDDTVLTDKPGFGIKANYWISYSNKLYMHTSGIKSGYLGNERSLGELTYIPGINSFYSVKWLGAQAKKTERLDGNTFEPLASCNGAVLSSLTGSFAYSNGFNGIDEIPHTFTKVNPLTFVKENETVYTSIIGYYASNSSFAVSEANILFFVGRNPYASGYGANILIDAVNRSLLGKDSTTHSDDGPVFISKKSDEGEYVCSFSSTNLLKIKNRILLRGVSVKGRFVGFTSSGKEYVSYDYSSIYINRCSDGSVIRTFPVQGEFRCTNIDPATGYLGLITIADENFKVFDVNDGSTKKEIHIAYKGYPPQFILLNSFLISSSRYYMKFNLVKGH